MFDQPVHNVWVGCGKLLGDLGGIPLEEQDRAVDRVGEGASQHELTAFVGLPGFGQVLLPEESAFFRLVAGHFIEKQIMHRLWISYGRGEIPAVVRSAPITSRAKPSVGS